MRDRRDIRDEKFSTRLSASLSIREARASGNVLFKSSARLDIKRDVRGIRNIEVPESSWKWLSSAT